MADVYMHAKLAKEVGKQLKKNLIEDLLVIGAQGPDPMYYGFGHAYHDRYRFFADRMHDTDTNLLFTELFQYAKDHPSVEVYSYIHGFLCHFALDVKIHPYVYHHVGQYDAKDPNTLAMRGLHLKFERSIDAALIEYDTKKKAQWYPIQKETFPIKQAPKEIKGLYQSLMQKRYQFPDGGQMIENSVKSMHQVLKYIVQDRTGLKKVFYKFVDLFNKEQDLFFQDLSMHSHLGNYDFLNQEHRTWAHPVTKETSSKSVFDLYTDAKTFAIELIEYFDQYLAGEALETIPHMIGNLSFNSGVDCEDKRPMNQYNIYLK